jgi:glucose-6-phosphate dehydrogenase assembly protein OpcA
MATAYKVLGQSYPTAATATTLYTVPSATSTVVSTIAICNQGSAADTIRIAIRVAGSALSSEEYIAYDEVISANSMMTITAGITLAATDVITIYSTSGTCSFNAFGSEIS